MPVRVNPTLAAELVASHALQYFLMDVDGVIWCGANVISQVPSTLQYLRTQGKRLRFLSNNASLSRRQLQQTFEARGISGVTENEVYNSAYASALRLQQLLGKPQEGNVASSEALVHGNVFVIGEQGLHDELHRVLAPGYITYGMELHDPEKAGGYNAVRMASAWDTPVLPAPYDCAAPHNGGSCRVVQPGSANSKFFSLSDLNAVAVVVGLDLHFNMLKLACAAMILQGPPLTRGSPRPPLQRPLFIATNEDPQIPIGANGVLLPGAGCMVRSLMTASGRDPDVVCGKPKVDMARALFAAEGIQDPQASCLMIGDRLTTDVAFGNAAGCKSMLVLSGIEGLDDVAEAELKQRTELLPDFVADSIACFLPCGSEKDGM